MERDLTPEEIEKHNNRKLTADKIRQILSKVMETPTQSSKRWVWELMQNAKDIPNRFGEVSIKIELRKFDLSDILVPKKRFSFIQTSCFSY